MKTFESGAKRSEDADDVSLDLIHPHFLIRIGRVLKTGSIKYGRHNWEKGIPIMECINHLFKHLCQWLMGDNEEDHLAHMCCNLMFIMTYELTLPHLFKGIRRKNGQLSEEMLSNIDNFKPVNNNESINFEMKPTNKIKIPTKDKEVELEMSAFNRLFEKFFYENTVYSTGSIIPLEEIVNLFNKKYEINIDSSIIDIVWDYLPKEKAFVNRNYTEKILDCIPHQYCKTFFDLRIQHFINHIIKSELGNLDSPISFDYLFDRFKDIYGINHLDFFDSLKKQCRWKNDNNNTLFIGWIKKKDEINA